MAPGEQTGYTLVDSYFNYDTPPSGVDSKTQHPPEWEEGTYLSRSGCWVLGLWLSSSDLRRNLSCLEPSTGEIRSHSQQRLDILWVFTQLSLNSLAVEMCSRLNGVFDLCAHCILPMRQAWDLLEDHRFSPSVCCNQKPSETLPHC